MSHTSISIHCLNKRLSVSTSIGQTSTGDIYRTVNLGSWGGDQPAVTIFLNASDPLYECLRAYAAKQADEELAAMEDSNVD